MLTTDTLVGSEASFMSSAHLIMGSEDAVLVDALFAKSDAQRVVDWIKASGKRLTAVYVTHAHPDHFLGLPVVLEAFPDARAVALPEIVEEIKELAPTYHRTYKPVFGEDLADSWVIPEPLTEPFVDLEGERLPILRVGPGEATQSSALYIPSAGAIATGDQIFNGVHVWLVEYRPEGSLAGIETLRSAGPFGTVLPGHGPAGDAGLLETNEGYIRAFMAAASAATTKDEGVAAMTEQYGEYSMPVILDFGMQAAVEGKSYPEIMNAFLSGGSQ
ncbi:MBL fold metallo-hydrolase [Arthrobacter ginkgonis]|uniref:MBL fold metallo-hydrolase n=1 Tax=Arthrobacter ginkgonis TaxID=1630594 RepID=A0ABP7D1M6_9MICC